MQAEAGGSSATPVAVDRNWQHRVQSEIESSRRWEAQWGFLSGGAQFKDSIDQFVNTHTGCNSTTALNLRESQRRKREAMATDSIDGFLHQYMVKAGGPAQRPLPKQEYQRPALSSHAVGWGHSLERFGPLKLHMR